MIEVEMGHWTSGEGSDCIRIGGVTSCVVISLHNKASQLGYGGHFSYGGATETATRGSDLDEMFDAAICDTNNQPGTIVSFVGGAALPHLDDAENYPEELANQTLLRAKVLQHLKKRGIRSPHQPIWLPPRKVLQVTLACNTGTFKHSITNELRPNIPRKGR